jgi:hypothetical protein
MDPLTADRRRTHRGLLLLGALVAVIARVLVSRHAVAPEVVADETSYLSMARWLAGGDPWNLGRAATYGAGYSVLIAPIFRLFDDPDQIFRAIVLLNAALGGLLVLALEAVARRLTNLRRPWTIAAATLAACLPALVVTSNHAWSDNVTPLAFALLLVAGFRLVESPGVRSAAVLVVVQGAAYATHGRFAPLALVTLALLVVLAGTRRLDGRVAGGAGVALVVVMVAVKAANDRVYEAVYQAGGGVTQTTRELDRILDLVPLSISASGQFWYLVVTTAGLAGFAVVALLRAGWRSAAPIRARLSARFGDLGASTTRGSLDDLGLGADRLQLLWFTALAALSFAVSSGFMTDRERPDQLVYGRYNDTIVGPLVLIGFATLTALTASRRRRIVDAVVVALAAVATGGYVWTLRLDLLEQPFVPTTILGLLALDEDATQQLRVVTLIGLGVFALAAAAALVPRSARTGRVALAVLLAVAVPVGIGRSAERYATDRGARVTSTEALRDLLGPDDEVVFALGAGAGVQGFYRYPFYDEDLRFYDDRDAHPWDDGHELVMAPLASDGAAAAGYRVMWVDPNSPNALWVGPGARQDRLAAAGDLLPASGTDGALDAQAAVSATGVEVADGRITGAVTIDRPAGAPWATVGPGADPTGRVRLGVRVTSASCDCVVAESREDLDRWVLGDEAQVEVDLDVTVPRLPAGPATVELQLLREQVAWFGAPATVEVTIAG